MKILIRSAEIIAPGNSLNKTIKNILIEDGIIKQITDEGNIEADKVVEGNNLKVSAGWFDMRVFTGDPGNEHKEDLTTVTNAAASGGFTGIAAMPDTNPPIHTKDVLAYVKTKAEKALVDVYPVAAVTLNLKGEELSEMIDLHHEGAVAFSDGTKPVWHSDVLLKTLQYLQKFNGLLINHAEDKLLSHSGQMNEGKVSTRLGLKGLPKLAEELMVERDLRILEYAGGKIHFAHVSSPVSLELIKAAKKKGLQVTCDIAAYQLALSDAELSSFDTNLKVNPPLRTASDIKAFWKAIDNNTIDVIVSDHSPQDIESKFLEFDLAEFGMIGLETAFAVVNTWNKTLSVEDIIDKIALAPRKILGLPIPDIAEGAPANLTVFNADAEWEFGKKHIKSKSANSPFVGKKLKGHAVAVFNKGRYFVNENFL
ncbi:dihydroorotase [Cytophagaceae bacterium ABcell3]|nr:dihydroorotase [Cytophagaceae bacterium ABcell3]